MKKLLLLLFSAVLAAAAPGAERKVLRVLMIGNSFSLSVMRELPKIVDAQDGYALDITSMYIGGCSLERHIMEYEKAKVDPEHRPYGIDRYVTGQGTAKRVKGNLIEMLDALAYDIVTIQQASPRSFDPSGWEPYGDKLVALVREKHPQAKILLHQTWSYRIDAPLLKKWKLSQDEMFEKVRAIYADRAKHFGCGVIPMGEAVQLYRRRTKAAALALPDDEVAKYRFPKTPSYKGDVVGCYRWRRSKKSPEKRVIWCDFTHLNSDGNYLQGCVWFAFLFGADATEIAYAPKHLKPAEAELIRKCAADAVSGKYE